MYTRFFLTLPYYIDPEKERGFAVYGGSRNNFASTHMPKKDDHIRSTFKNCLERFARKTARVNKMFGSDASLIFLDDTVTFQLETVAVVDNSYCTYNIDTKLIGFGSGVYEASEVTDSRNGMTTKGSFNSNDSIIMMDFNLPESVPEFDQYSYLVPDAFYESVLNELIPYINYIKIQKFKNVTTEIIRYANAIDEYVDNFFEETYDAPSLDYTLNDFILAARMFIDDDPVLLQNKQYMESYYICMGILCRKFQELTNETF